MDQLITPPTPEQLSQRAHLLGKMQTSLMRDGWGITGLDAHAGTLEVTDVASYGTSTFTLSLSVPEAEKPLPAAVPMKRASGGKRKR